MNAPSVILAMDSATTGCSVCVWQDGHVLAQETKPMKRGQAEALIPMAHAALKHAGLEPKSLTAIAVTNGPGAFTGLRIGLAAARGLALALAVPCVGVTTLEALAHGTASDERVAKVVLVCVESKRADIFVQVFSQDLHPLMPPKAAGEQALFALLDGHKDILLVGDAADRAFDMLSGTDLNLTLSQANTLPDPAVIARLAESRMGQVSTPEPLYLRPPDAKLPSPSHRRVRT